MTTCDLRAPATPLTSGTDTGPARGRRPPTARGNAAPGLVEAGRSIADKALDLQLEDRDFEEALSELLRIRPSRTELEMAHDHLAFSHLDAPLAAQVDALFLVDAAAQRITGGDPASGSIAARLRYRKRRSHRIGPCAPAAKCSDTTGGRGPFGPRAA